MQTRSWLGALMLASSIGWAATARAGIDVTIDGIDDEIRESVRASLALVAESDRDASEARVRYLYANAEEEIKRALEPFGYYNAQVTGTIERGQDGDFLAHFEIDKGSPVRVTRVDLDVPRAASSLEPVANAIHEFELGPGDRLDHGLYESGKERIATALRATGFFDADLVRHRVAVDTAANTAEIDLAWAPGQRYRLGATRFSDSQFTERFLAGYVPWTDGDPYDADAVLDLQQRLAQTEYFQTVSVQPLLDERVNGRVPVEVIVTPNERNLYRAGVQYSTDYGVGGNLGYERRWLNSRGHRLEVDTQYSERLEEYSTTYEIPRPRHGDGRYSLGAAYRDEQSESSRSRSTRLAAAESRNDWKGYARKLGVQYLDGDFEVGGTRDSSTLLFAEGTLGRKHYDDFMFPRDGYAFDTGLRLAPSGFVSDTSLVQAWVGHKQLLRQGDRSRFILRAQLGALTTGDFDKLPPELRFFAGGDRSIRGFGYQEIGEVNELGKVVGGKYLAIASFEYEHYFARREKWGAAIFSDAGDAFSTSFDENVSVGVGLRWRSPIGVVRVDVAKPVVTRFDDGIGVHVTIGPDL
jgi:translocation and assembly module TamA